MSRFAELQNQFQAFVLRGGRDVEATIVGDDLASSRERLAVYFDAYRLRLLGILETEFPGVRALTSAGQFREIGLGYLDAHPSSYRSVRWFAKDFAPFVAQVQDQHGVPYLGEMAAFEWARGRAFDALTGPVLGAQDLAKLPADQWPAMTITMPASVRCVPFAWNTDDVWRSINAGEPLAPAAQRPEPTTCCVWRRDLTVYWRLMDRAEVWAFGEFGSGKDFSQVCSGLGRFYPEVEVPSVAAGLLSRWIGEGLIATIRA